MIAAAAPPLRGRAAPRARRRGGLAARGHCSPRRRRRVPRALDPAALAPAGRRGGRRGRGRPDDRRAGARAPGGAGRVAPEVGVPRTPSATSCAVRCGAIVGAARRCSKSAAGGGPERARAGGRPRGPRAAWAVWTTSRTSRARRADGWSWRRSISTSVALLEPGRAPRSPSRPRRAACASPARSRPRWPGCGAATRCGCCRCSGTSSATRSSSRPRARCAFASGWPGPGSGAAVRFEVADTGIGIAHEAQESHLRRVRGGRAAIRPARRHRPRPRAVPAAGGGDGRGDRRVERGGRGQHVLGRRCRCCGPRRRGARRSARGARACWWWRTTRSTSGWRWRC